MLKNKLSMLILLELGWWIFTALVCIGVLYPITSKLPDYIFKLDNIIFIIIFITFTRYIFLLPHTWLAKLEMPKVVILFACVPIVFYLVDHVNLFQNYIDTHDGDVILSKLAYDDRAPLMEYMRNEMLLFGAAAIVSGIILPLRLVMSVWRVRNEGTV